MNSRPEIIDNSALMPKKRTNLLLPAAGIWGAVVVIILAFLIVSDFQKPGRNDYFLLPWSIGAGVLLLLPAAYLFYRGNRDIFHPLIFALWSYIFPAFVIGGIILAFGWTRAYFLVFVNNPQIDYPLSLAYVVLGYYGLVIGFFIPIGKGIAKGIDRWGPHWNWSAEDLWIPGVVFLSMGVGLNILGFLQGIFGFQRVDEIGALDSVLVFLAISFTVGYVLLWLAFFLTKQKTPLHWGIFTVMILMIPFRMALQGGRSGLLLILLPIALAFWYSDHKITWKHITAVGVMGFVAVMIGVIYGTTFRNIKGSEARVSAGDYVGQIGETIDYLSRKDTLVILGDGMQSLAERVDNLSSLAVVVSNYEALEPYEESYGLKDNIINDLLTAFVPRFAWPDKPTTSDPRAYSDLYFNYGENSFAITPFGDLLRNFGVIGILIGMIIVGVYLRAIYSYLIETENPQPWKTASYFPLLTVVSYEGFYAVIFPSMIRVLLVIVVCMIIGSLLIRDSSRMRSF
ncbi:MAG: hypothetical protein R2684_07410 [Pyrinomonadaceae bacterium]